VTLLEALPAPAAAHAQHGVGQGAQVVGHLLDREHAFHVARQRAKDLGVVRATQQVQQRLFVVVAAGGQRLTARLEVGLELRRLEALLVQLLPGQVVDHTGMAQQVARRPLGGTEHAQQPLVHRRALLQQRQVALAAQQRLDPVAQAQRRALAHPPFLEPSPGALQQPQQALARALAQTLHARRLDPLRHPQAQPRRQLRQHGEPIVARRRRRVAVAAFAVAGQRTGPEQGVELLRHQFALGVEHAQKSGGVGKA